MARMPQIAWVGGASPSIFSFLKRSIPLILGFGFAVQAYATASENDVFQVRSLESASVLAVSPTELPFDSIELDLKSLLNPIRPIEVRLWKDNHAYRPQAKFRLLPLDLSNNRIVLRCREKNEEIMIVLDPMEKKLLKISYRKEESIGEVVSNAWAWLSRTFAPPAAVAAAVKN